MSLRYNILCRQAAPDGRPGGVAQLGERLTGSQEVMGSIPTVSTKVKKKDVFDVKSDTSFFFCTAPANMLEKQGDYLCKLPLENP